jgi:hypothetical protein
MTHLLGQLPQYLTEEHQAAVLAQLRTPLPLPLQIAAVEAASGLGDVECQRRAWSSVLSRVGPEIHPKLHDLWSSMLRVDTRRAHLLDRLRAYVPFVATRGGDAGLAETIRAIADVGAIWP